MPTRRTSLNALFLPKLEPFIIARIASGGRRIASEAVPAGPRLPEQGELGGDRPAPRPDATLVPLRRSLEERG